MDENKCFHTFCLFNLIVKVLKYSNSLADNQFSVVNHHQNKKITKIIRNRIIQHKKYVRDGKREKTIKWQNTDDEITVQPNPLNENL